MKPVYLLAVIACIAAAQTRLGPPRRGVILDSEQLRPLLGVSGSLTAGPVLSRGVLAAASSGLYTLVKTHARIEVLREEQEVCAVEAPAGGAVFAFAPDGAPALACLAASREALLWDGRCFRPGWRIDGGEPLAAAVWSPGRVVLALESESEIRLETRSLGDGRLLGVEALPQARGPVLLIPGGGALYWDGEQLVVAAPGEPPLRLALEGRPEALLQAGEEFIVARLGGRAFGIVLAGGRTRLFELPSPAPEVKP